MISPAPERRTDERRTDERSADVVVAVDLGGTLTKIAYVARDGSATDVRRVDTMIDDHGAVPPEWLAQQVVAAAAARPEVSVVGYGLVAPGIIDVAAGVVRVAPNVGWRDVPVRQVLDTVTGLPGAIGHDVRGGGLAEWRLGRGVGCDNLLFLALGTGIAGASIVDGRMLEAGGYAGEIGHLHVSVADHRCAERRQQRSVFHAALHHEFEPEQRTGHRSTKDRTEASE